MKHIQAKTIHDLNHLLITNNIDLEHWGYGETKTINHLFDEIKNNECTLIERHDQLFRYINVATMSFVYNDIENFLFLREQKQIFSDLRERNRIMISSVSEKMYIGENPIDAIKRGIYEELGFKYDEVGNYTERYHKRSSLSYPGVYTYYHFYDFSSYMPEKHFDRNGYIEKQIDKHTYWVWQKIKPSSS